tara:strand:- start:2088 stop:2273 length:186 start_codon:yes stop_codon:yes gene_type:complete
LLNLNGFSGFNNDGYYELIFPTIGKILPMVERIEDSELFRSLEVIYFDEPRSVEELRMMLG